MILFFILFVRRALFRYIGSLEVMQDPSVSARLSDTKAAAEVKALEDFYAMMQNDPNRAFYGLVVSVSSQRCANHVELVASFHAYQKYSILLISL